MDGRVALPALMSQAVRDGLAVARAEVRLARAKLSARVSAAKSGAILIGTAALLALLGLIGLTVGCVLALATLIGPGLAGLSIFGATILVAAILGWLGARRLATPAVPVAAPAPRGPAA